MTLKNVLIFLLLMAVPYLCVSVYVGTGYPWRFTFSQRMAMILPNIAGFALLAYFISLNTLSMSQDQVIKKLKLAIEKNGNSKYLAGLSNADTLKRVRAQIKANRAAVVSIIGEPLTVEVETAQ